MLFKMARTLLISYAGYPYTPSSLMPDNGLAMLAGQLVDNGHDVKILDYGTVSTISGIIGADERKFLEKTYDSLMSLKDKNGFIKNVKGLYYINQLKRFDKHLEKKQEEFVERISEDISDMVEKEKIDMVGFKLYLGDGFVGSSKIAQSVKKKNPGVLVVGGGPTVDLVMQKILEVEDAYDILTFAEGEDIAPLLADYSVKRKNLAEIPNLLYKDGDNIVTTRLSRVEDLSRLSEPVYDSQIYLAMDGKEKFNIIVFDESRGCPNACAYCAQLKKSGHQRLRDSNNVVDNIENLINKYNFRAFRYAGSSTPYHHMKDIAQEMINRNLKLIYSSFGHAREEFDDFAILKKSGLSTLLIGIESGSQEILDKINKGNLTNQIENTFNKVHERGIFTVGSVIVPLPGETDDSLKETFDLLLKIKPSSVFLSFPGLYPGTQWAKNPQKFGFEMKTKDYEKFILDYKLKTLFPPSFWKPLPYKLDGRNFKQIAKITENFGKKLEQNGLVTRLTDDMVITAEILKINLEDYKKDISRSLYIGDAERIEQIIEEFNTRTANGDF